MAIPLATTTITILRQKPEDIYEEPYSDEQESDRVVFASGIRAVLMAPATRAGQGQETTRGGEQVRVAFALACDPVDLRHTDWIKDERTGEVFEVIWTAQRVGFGLDHTSAQMFKTEGLF